MRTLPLSLTAFQSAPGQTASRRGLHPRRLVLAAIALAIASVGLPASSQTPQTTPAEAPHPRPVPAFQRQPNYVMLDAKPAADPEETSEATPNDANHVGLKLHGHWVIDVLNPDHSLAHHHDFENALDSYYGTQLVLGLIGGFYASGNPEILLIGPNPNNSPCSVLYCEIVGSTALEPGKYDCTVTSANHYCSANLTVTFTPSNLSSTNTSSLVIAGSLTANQAGQIDTVYTRWTVCQGTSTSAPATTAPSSCQALTSIGGAIYGGSSGGDFSDGTLNLTSTNPSAISVASGQIIQVTITYTIS